MKTYKLQDWGYVTELGEVVDVEDNGTIVRVRILAILKVDFKRRTLWFSGVPIEDLFD